MDEIIHTDVFIAGAGAAGIAAAYAAAESGMNVCIAERNSFPGGRATASAVGTICGLYLRSDRAPEFAMDGFPVLFAEKMMKVSGKGPVKFGEGLWFLPSLPDDFQMVAEYFLRHEKIKTLFETKVEKVESSAGKVKAVYCLNQNKTLKIFAQAVIDCSGEGVICSSLNHEVVRDKEYQAAAIVFAMKNISAEDEFSLGFSLLKQITAQIENGIAPEYYNLISLIPSSLSKNSALLKMGLPWKVTDESVAALQSKASQMVSELGAFIRLNVTGFENAEIDWVAKEVGIRTGIRAKGKKILSDDDVLNCRKQEDGICNGAWPVEYWRPGSKRVDITYFKEKDFYTIPAGCLESAEQDNLFFAGKIISADEKAIASARVIGTCLGTGYAAGILASAKARNGSAEESIQIIRKKMLMLK